MTEALTPSLILNVEDHPISRLGLTLTLQSAGYTVIEADNAQTAYELALKHRPQGAIIDIEIPATPGSNEPQPDYGIDLGRQLKEQFPLMGIVFFSAYLEYARNVFDLVFRAKQGLAYQHKSNRSEQVLNALKLAMEGKIIIEASILADTHRLEDGFVKSLGTDERVWVERVVQLLELDRDKGGLTRREKEIAQRVAWSQTNEAIGVALYIAPGTVEKHIYNIYEKLGLNEMEKTVNLRKEIILAKAITLYQLRHQEELWKDKEGVP